MPRSGSTTTTFRVKSRARALLSEESGVVFTEYVIVFAFAGLLVALGMAALGPKVVHSYSSRRAVLYDSEHP